MIDYIIMFIIYIRNTHIRKDKSGGKRRKAARAERKKKKRRETSPAQDRRAAARRCCCCCYVYSYKHGTKDSPAQFWNWKASPKS